MNNNQGAIIIGAGIAGLAAAIRLAVKGYKVNVFEKNPTAGGKIAQYSSKGYRFDAGPSLFTLPEKIEELFFLAGENTGDHFRYHKLETVCRYFFADGTVIDSFSDPEKFAAEMHHKTGENPENIISYLKKAKALYGFSSEIFIDNSFHKRSNYYTNKAFRKAGLKLWKLDPFFTMHQRNTRSFQSGKTIQLFDRYATYNGSSPYKTPATLKIIAHLEHNLGAYFPEKGMYDIAVQLQKLAERKGVVFHFNTIVEEVLFEGRQVSGVIAGGKPYRATVVVNDSDVATFYSTLMPEKKIPKRVLKGDRSTSAMIFYWGMKNTFSTLKLHNILFSNNYPEEFDHLFQKKTITSDPTIYIFISKKLVVSDAPEGKENWFVMINTPEDTGQDWSYLVRIARENIRNKIKKQLAVDVNDFIETEHVVTPKEIEKNTLSYHGSLYGSSSNSQFAAFMRHPNFSRKHKGLYFAGGSVHPGGGIPLCLASAAIIDKEILSL
ncbi:MAG: phytoene desaturase family protein [Bacteroidales bacterium]|nr:phytoene desaturase family protein [Bacteroidales bacterium]MDY0286386.1 1-hydroxycarotenoid 3,4-desaturase CrtD [Bacteroidales bacterium]